MRRIKNLLFIFLIVFFIISCCVPIKVYANDFWVYNRDKQIYRRWKTYNDGSYNYEFYCWYQITTKIETLPDSNVDIRGSGFVQEEGSSVDEDKYLKYYYKVGDEIGLKVKEELGVDNHIDAGTGTYIYIEGASNDTYDYESNGIKIRDESDTNSGTSLKDTKYCNIYFSKYNEESADFNIKIEKLVPKNAISNNGFKIYVTSNEKWYFGVDAPDMLLIHFIPYCTLWMEGLESEYGRNNVYLANSERTGLTKEIGDAINDVITEDGKYTINENMKKEEEWKSVDIGNSTVDDVVQQKQLTVERRKQGATEEITYNTTYKFAYVKDYGMLYYKITNETITTQMSDTEKEENANNSHQNAIYEAKEDATQMMTLISKKIGQDRVEKPFTGVLDDIGYYEPTDEDVSTDITDKVSVILTIITNIGMIIAVLMSAILGLKYMLGSVEEKADYKKGMIPYFVGAILLFGICTIVKVMQQLGESINNI